MLCACGRSSILFVGSRVPDCTRPSPGIELGLQEEGRALNQQVSIRCAIPVDIQVLAKPSTCPRPRSPARYSLQAGVYADKCCVGSESTLILVWLPMTWVTRLNREGQGPASQRDDRNQPRASALGQPDEKIDPPRKGGSKAGASCMPFDTNAGAILAPFMGSLGTGPYLRAQCW